MPQNYSARKEKYNAGYSRLLVDFWSFATKRGIMGGALANHMAPSRPGSTGVQGRGGGRCTLECRETRRIYP